MDKDCVYNIYTDASFDNTTNLSTYSIIVKNNNKTSKIISKKVSIRITNSVESEIFAIYQAINLILCTYINCTKTQKFSINTDCSSARDFYLENDAHQKVFYNYSELYYSMKKIYKTICNKLSCNNSSFSIKWIPKKKNSIAHHYSYSAFQKLKNFPDKSDLFVIDQNAFFEILSGSCNKHANIIMFLYNESDQQKMICMTQTQMASLLQLPLSVFNRCLKELQRLNIVQKIQNGKYALLI